MTFQTSVVTDVVVGNNFVHKRSAVCVVAPSPCYRFLSRLIAVMSHPVVRNYEILMLCETCVKSFYFFLVFFAQPRVETLALLSLLEVRVRYSWFSIGASRPRSPQKLFFVLLILILVPASAHLSCTYIYALPMTFVLYRRLGLPHQRLLVRTPAHERSSSRSRRWQRTTVRLPVRYVIPKLAHRHHKYFVSCPFLGPR